ncbi:MAG: phosphatase PAP2 family protein [Anaerolineales bacterium]
MDAWVQSGLDMVLRAQAIGPWLRTPMVFFTSLGMEPFYMLVMPALLWCVDAALGLRIGFVLIGSLGLNAILKLAFQLPRPYWVSADVHAYSIETSFGLPSGHAQNAVAVWGRLAAAFNSMWAKVAAAILILLISFSRLYLGVHFPLDVAAGWLVGGALLLGFLRLEEPVWRRLRGWSLGWQIGVAFLASGGLILLGALALQIHAGENLPSVWLRAMSAVQLSDAFVDPRGPEGTITAAGTLFGFAAGGILLVRWGGFDARGRWTMRVGRYLLGALGVALLLFGLDLLTFPSGSTADLIWRYLRYAAIGFWISYLGPRMFDRMGLVPDAPE